MRTLWRIVLLLLMYSIGLLGLIITWKDYELTAINWLNYLIGIICIQFIYIPCLFWWDDYFRKLLNE